VYVTEDVPGVRLTLLTCDPPGTTTRRLVIQSELISGEFIDLALPDDEWEFLGK
jgi:sortase (surface protein transpeptidase)